MRCSFDIVCLDHDFSFFLYVQFDSCSVRQFRVSVSPPLSKVKLGPREARATASLGEVCDRRPRFFIFIFFTHSAKFIRFELWSYGPAVVVHTLLLGGRDLETGPPGARSGFRFGNGIFILLFCTLYLSRIWNVEKGIKSSWAWGLRHKSGRIDYRFTKFTALPWALPTPTTRQNARRRPDRLRHQTTRRRTPLAPSAQVALTPRANLVPRVVLAALARRGQCREACGSHPGRARRRALG